MTSQMVARAAALRTDPVGRYPAAKPATAPAVPPTSASPNRARHARHHPLAPASAPSWPAASRSAAVLPATPPVGDAGPGPVPAAAHDMAAVSPIPAWLPAVGTSPPPPC